jgi:pimeloyl-ACP methyl ester carboxylesterase
MRTTVNGIELGYTDEGQGTPLVFVHGFPLSRGVWRKQIDAFRASHRAIALDLRGFGESTTPPGPTTIVQYAEDLESLLQELATGPVVLIGHSMGGYVALAFARRFPVMLRGLVLVGTKAGQDTPEAAAARRATAEQVKAEGVRGVIESMAPKMLAASNEDARLAAQVRGFMATARPDGVSSALLAMAERPDATPLLADITVPTLVVAGMDDTIIAPREAEKSAQAIRAAHLELISHAGHLVALERPEEFNRILKAWLAGVGLAGADRSAVPSRG